MGILCSVTRRVFCCRGADNGIGPEGVNALAEMLKGNSSLKSMNLSSKFVFSFFVSIFLCFFHVVVPISACSTTVCF